MEKHTMTSATKVLMICTAVFFDLTQFGISFIPIAGQIISMLLNIFAQLTFFLWFQMKGVSYGGTKRLAAFATGTVVGFIPILDMLPELTFEVFLILGTLTAEEQLSKVPGGAMAVGMAQQAAQNHPETKNLKGNFQDLKSDRAGKGQRMELVQKDSIRKNLEQNKKNPQFSSSSNRDADYRKAA